MTRVLLVQGTALHLPLKDASVHTCVTSPPYYGLRSYGIGEGELGLEPTLEAYVEAMVQVFREVKRVLRPDATLWLNLGDVYSSGNRNSFGPLTGKNVAVKVAPRMAQPPTLPEKSLLGLPWRVALAMQADGWTLRADCIWDKPSCMPESVQDRPTRSHEYVFLFSKQARYHYDAEAVKENTDALPDIRLRLSTFNKAGESGNHHQGNALVMTHGRNARTVWRIPSEPFSGSHFATFPTALVRRCLLAGAPTQVCRTCAAPYRREVERICTTPGITGGATPYDPLRPDGMRLRAGGFGNGSVMTTGLQPTCTCASSVAASVVLDPFCGSGTTLLVARELGHHAVGVDLSYSYLHDIARQRLSLTALAAWEGRNGHSTPAPAYDDLPLFATGGA